MNPVLWIVVGAAIAWLSHHKFNRSRALLVVLFIGAVGGFFGGSVITPLLQAAPAEPVSHLRPFALIVAAASASACLLISDMLCERFDL